MTGAGMSHGIHPLYRRESCLIVVHDHQAVPLEDHQADIHPAGQGRSLEDVSPFPGDGHELFHPALAEAARADWCVASHEDANHQPVVWITTFTVPADAAEGDYFNLVLEVTDNGAPALTRYAQVIVTAEPAPAQEN